MEENKIMAVMIGCALTCAGASLLVLILLATFVNNKDRNDRGVVVATENIVKELKRFK